MPAVRVHFDERAKWHEQDGKDLRLAPDSLRVEVVVHEVAHWVADCRDPKAHAVRHHGKAFRQALDQLRGWGVVWSLENE